MVLAMFDLLSRSLCLLACQINLCLFKQCSIINDRWYYVRCLEMNEGVCLGYYSLY